MVEFILYICAIIRMIFWMIWNWFWFQIITINPSLITSSWGSLIGCLCIHFRVVRFSNHLWMVCRYDRPVILVRSRCWFRIIELANGYNSLFGLNPKFLWNFEILCNKNIFNNLELCLTYLISRQRPFPMAVLSGSVTSLINSKSPSPIAINITTAKIEFKEFLEKKF